jgi:hypothetical protein
MNEILNSFKQWLFRQEHLPSDICEIVNTIETKTYSVPYIIFKGEVQLSWAGECGFNKKRVVGYRQVVKDDHMANIMDVKGLGSSGNNYKTVNEPIYEHYTEWEYKQNTLKDTFEFHKVATDKLPNCIEAFFNDKAQSKIDLNLDFSEFEQFDGEFILDENSIWANIKQLPIERIRQKIRTPGDQIRNLQTNIDDLTCNYSKHHKTLYILSYMYKGNKYWYIYFNEGAPMASKTPVDKESVDTANEMANKYWTPFLIFATVYLLFLFFFDSMIGGFAIFGIYIKYCSSLILAVGIVPLNIRFYQSTRDIAKFTSDRSSALKAEFESKLGWN